MQIKKEALGQAASGPPFYTNRIHANCTHLLFTNRIIIIKLPFSIIATAFSPEPKPNTQPVSV